MSDAVIRALSDEPAVSSLAVLPGASVRPAGDVVLADVAREAANDVVDRLRALELHREGSLDIDHVRAWLSQRGLDAEQLAPGSSADSVVWVDVTHQAYAESEFNWTSPTSPPPPPESMRVGGNEWGAFPATAYVLRLRS